MDIFFDTILPFIDTLFESWVYSAIRIFGAILTLIFAVATFIFIKRGNAPQRHIRHLMQSWNASALPKHRLYKKWLTIQDNIDSDDVARWRQAIMDSDMMLDEIITRIGYEGETMEARLEKVNLAQFPSLEDAKRAHKVYQFLEDDPLYALTPEVARTTVEIYGRIFRETGVIL